MTMFGYVTLGTNDLARAASFYDQLLAPLGARRTMEGDSFIAWGTSRNAPALGLVKPYDGLPASRGNGTMVALSVPTPSQVDALYKLALSLGASDEGAPGPRGPSFYAAYFRDLDGNKLNFCCFS
jgi:catechol 2,3-dioxygenase-like lactoylglutathione lyase family enzyme